MTRLQRIKRQKIHDRMMTDSNYLLLCIAILLYAQDEDEIEECSAKWANKQGFNKIDAKKYTDTTVNAVRRGYLTDAELATLRELDEDELCPMAHYWRQLPLPDDYLLDSRPKRPPQNEGGAIQSNRRTA